MLNKELTNTVAQTIEYSHKKDYQYACAYLDNFLEKISQKPALLNNLGLLFYQKVEYDFACRCFYFLLQHHEKQYSCHNNLGLTLNRFGWGEKAVEHYQKALAIKEDYHAARSNLAYALHYFGKTGRPEIKQAHKAINKYVFNQSKNYLTGKDINVNPTRKLSLGYVSSDFRNHAVGRFLIGLFTQHNHENFDIHIFDNRVNNNDKTAKKLKELPLKWHDISALNTNDSCNLITQLNIDVLIDLSGHTNGGRPDIFSNRVAPSQITYLGYPNTSGLEMMDFRIGDIHADPLENQDQNTETMLRLPFPMWNYTPWADMPDATLSPFEKNGYITFGSANNHAKLQQQWLEVWAKALAALPKTRFKIKSRALRNPKMANDLLDFFQSRGVSNQRIMIEHYSPSRAEHWESLSSFDIALDSYPYNGTTTSCDLLWLGVPIITRQGNSHVSRTTASLLNGIGMHDWVAKTDKRFIELCEEKSFDRFSLKQSRQTLRSRMKHSSINHDSLFIIEFEKLIRQAWQTTCSNKQFLKPN